jgi:glycosyltransferase involved in cell wall biosynthesis
MRPIVIDVTRLLSRRYRQRIPTGVDRVCLAYIEHYGPRARALIRYRRWTWVASHASSRQLFAELLSGLPPEPPRIAWMVLRSYLSSGSESIAGSLLFSLGHAGLDRSDTKQWMRSLGATAVFLLHDLIPLTHPEYSRPEEEAAHRRRLEVMLDVAALIVTNSDATLAELRRYAAALGRRLPPSEAILIGARELPPATDSPSLEGPYFLTVGTIEPRKNHLLLLHLWRRLVHDYGAAAPKLVVIGQRGWECENVVDLLERCRMLEGHVIEKSNCGDAEMASWVRHARAVLMPSFVEGYGLPVAEALQSGVPVIASDLAVYREFAGDIPEYLDPLDALSWRKRIESYALGDESRDLQLARMKGWKAPTWTEHFAKLDARLAQLENA